MAYDASVGIFFIRGTHRSCLGGGAPLSLQLIYNVPECAVWKQLQEISQVFAGLFCFQTQHWETPFKIVPWVNSPFEFLPENFYLESKLTAETYRVRVAFHLCRMNSSILSHQVNVLIWNFHFNRLKYLFLSWKFTFVITFRMTISSLQLGENFRSFSEHHFILRN